MIPFHLQLRGAAKSLSAFLGLHDAASVVAPPADGTRTKRASPRAPSLKPRRSMSSVRPSPQLPPKLFDAAAMYPWAVQSPYLFVGGSPEDLRPLRTADRRDTTKALVRVFLLRQVSARVRGQKAWRNCVVGEGELWPVSPSPAFDGMQAEESVALDWAGEVRCSEDVGVPSFASGELGVKVRSVSIVSRE